MLLQESNKPPNQLKVQYPVKIAVPGQGKALEYEELDEVLSR